MDLRDRKTRRCFRSDDDKTNLPDPTRPRRVVEKVCCLELAVNVLAVKAREGVKGIVLAATEMLYFSRMFTSVMGSVWYLSGVGCWSYVGCCFIRGDMKMFV